ncbi:reverse transcriptase protein [Rutstroemia sp. NJR-2017a BBW]|nr:reverse transcriptase protein [Rutstroemia sp. NJR-2017a BBW]
MEEQANISSWPESIAAHGHPDSKNLKLYGRLRKAESSVLFQARTGRIGLRRFLASARVPGIESGECLCGQGLETAEHTLLACADQPPPHWEPGTRFEELVSEAETAAVVARQLIRSGKLRQYSLAAQLLYNTEEVAASGRE